MLRGGLWGLSVGRYFLFRGGCVLSGFCVNGAKCANILRRYVALGVSLLPSGLWECCHPMCALGIGRSLFIRGKGTYCLRSSRFF